MLNRQYQEFEPDAASADQSHRKLWHGSRIMQPSHEYEQHRSDDTYERHQRHGTHNRARTVAGTSPKLILGDVAATGALVRHDPQKLARLIIATHEATDLVDF